MKTWEEFKKYKWHNFDELDFYGCVDKGEVWFDSADSFVVAVHWCCFYAGEFNLRNEGAIQ